LVDLLHAQAWPRPEAPVPVGLVGAGGIARIAHLPAYARIGVKVAAVHDKDQAAARKLARDFGIPDVCATLEELREREYAIYDVATPAEAQAEVLQGLPDGCAVLLQKPLGVDLAHAKRIAAIARRKGLVVALNFQLRFAPNVLALKSLLARGVLGRVHDIEVRENTWTPWSTWSFLAGIPRMEILYHSIHSLDLVRHLLGEPLGVHCLADRDPAFPDHADTRCEAILAYEAARASVRTLHSRRLVGRHAMSQIQVSGTNGTAVLKAGVNLAYPHGEPDALWVQCGRAPGAEVPLRGNWFIEAFEGPMSNLQRHVSGEDAELVSPLEDALRTMAVVEACYRSAAARPTHIPSIGRSRGR
jgi:predicted dehydrogenase